MVKVMGHKLDIIIENAFCSGCEVMNVDCICDLIILILHKAKPIVSVCLLFEFSKATLKTKVVINWFQLDFFFRTVCFCIHLFQESPSTCQQGSWHLNTNWPAGSEGRSTESKPSDLDANSIHLALPHVCCRMGGWIKLLHVRDPLRGRWVYCI